MLAQAPLDEDLQVAPLYSIMGEASSPIHHYGRDPLENLHMATNSKRVASIKQGFLRDASLELPRQA